MLARGRLQAERAVDAGGAVLHRHGLGSARLLIQLDAAETRQEVGDAAVDQMATVELGGDLHCQSQLAPGRLHAAAIGDRPHEIAAEPIKPCTWPLRICSHASTVLRPLSRGGSKPNCFFSFSFGTNSGFSVMPTVRWPCTFEWPRTGPIPAPGQPILPSNSRKLTTILTDSTPLRWSVR